MLDILKLCVKCTKCELSITERVALSLIDSTSIGEHLRPESLGGGGGITGSENTSH